MHTQRHISDGPGRAQQRRPVKRCMGCKEVRRRPDALLCSPCWAGLPQPLKNAFQQARDGAEKRVAARKIVDYLALQCGQGAQS